MVLKWGLARAYFAFEAERKEGGREDVGRVSGGMDFVEGGKRGGDVKVRMAERGEGGGGEERKRGVVVVEEAEARDWVRREVGPEGRGRMSSTAETVPKGAKVDLSEAEEVPRGSPVTNSRRFSLLGVVESGSRCVRAKTKSLLSSGRATKRERRGTTFRFAAWVLTRAILT